MSTVVELKDQIRETIEHLRGQQIVLIPALQAVQEKLGYLPPEAFEEVGDTRVIHNWKAEFKLKQCKVCGKYFAPEAQLDYLRRTLDLPEEHFELCQDCRVKTVEDA